MALPNRNLLRDINLIAESLGSGECKSLLYLCGHGHNLDTDDNACVKEMLKSKVMSYENGYLFLAELMLQIKRYDILRKVFSTNRDEVERTLKYKEVLPRFRVLMAHISADMANEDLKSVKFLLGGMLPREKVDKAKNFLDIITELEKLDEVSSEKVDLIEECLRNIGRVDLAKKVIVYKTSVVTSEQRSCQQQRHRVPFPSFTPNSSQSPQQTRLGQSLHIAREHIPVPLYREQNCQIRPLDSYNFNSDPRGVCVIIDCVGNDGEMLEHTFKSLHFNVVLHKLLSVGDTLSTLRGIFRQRGTHGGDGFVCCIISRGTAGHLLATDSRGSGLRLDMVRRLFTADACPILAGRPKLFFIQRYSVGSQPCARTEHRDEDLETDGCDGLSRSNLIPTDADVFWSHCWTDERQLRRRDHRSVYLKAVTDALQKGQRSKTHLVDAHIEVNGAIYEHNNRNPDEEYHIDLKHTLRKELYLQ
ncbi:hypothetical protein PAMA_003350 [Pampus argenteus]